MKITLSCAPQYGNELLRKLYELQHIGDYSALGHSHHQNSKEFSITFPFPNSSQISFLDELMRLPIVREHCTYELNPYCPWEEQNLKKKLNATLSSLEISVSARNCIENELKHLFNFYSQTESKRPENPLAFLQLKELKKENPNLFESGNLPTWSIFLLEMEMGPQGLIRIPNLGKKHLKSIKEAVEKVNLHLGFPYERYTLYN